MHRLLLASLLLIPCSLFPQAGVKDLQLAGTANQLNASAVLTLKGTSQLLAEAGAIVDLSAATVTLPAAFALDSEVTAALVAHTGDATDAHAASAITNTPAGTIAATTVQVALNELDTEKAPLASPALTGTPTAPTAAAATNTTQLATTAFVSSAVDTAVQALDLKASVRAIATTNLTLSGTQTVDGVALVAGDRLLVAGQTTAAQNGIYLVAAGAWTRATDADTSADVTTGMFTFVSEGTANGSNGYALTTPEPIVLGTTALTFSQFSGAGQIIAGTGLAKSGNTLSISSSYVGQTSLTTLGVITAGTWQATAIADAYIASAAAWNAKEPAITAGTTAQYWRGDKTWQPLNQAAVAGLTTADGPTFASLSTGSGAISGGLISGTAGFQFRGATGTSYELFRLVGATKNPGVFVRAVEASGDIVYNASGSTSGYAHVFEVENTERARINPTGFSVTGSLNVSDSVSLGLVNNLSVTYSDGIIYRSGGIGTNAGFHRFRYFDTEVARIDSTGISVTGAGTFTDTIMSTGGGIQSVLSYGGSEATVGSLSAHNVRFLRGGSTIATFTASGVDVTGSINATYAYPNNGAVWTSNSTSTHSAFVFVNPNGTVGTINTSGTTTSYNTSSDARLKTNIRDLTGSGAILDALRPVLHDWKSGTKDTYGFIAQEVYSVFPQAVSRGDDDPDTITQAWAMDAAKLVPVLVAETKSLRARVAQLESAIDND